jgi:hypothetical protein
MLRESEVIPAGATMMSAIVYENARFERSFVRVLASVPEDIAFRRRAILLNSYFPAYPYYWVRPRAGPVPPPEFRINLNRSKGALTLLVQRSE